MRSKVHKWLKRVNAVAVENPVCPGTPDTNYGGVVDGVQVEGWLELKSVDEPKREETVVNCDHYSPQQRVWHVRRSRAGGNVHMLIKIGQWWLLFEGTVAAKHLGKCPMKELKERAVRVWHGDPKEDLLACLKKICR